MQQAEIIRLETASSREAPPASTSWTAVGRVALTGGVLLYLALILVGPVLALAFETTKIGWGRALGAVASPAALDALFMSVMLVVISLVVNAAVGSVGALCLVRHRFLGRGLLGALFDLPLAVSPVMIGLAFLLLVGRGGTLHPLIDSWGWQIVFSFPGLVIGTLFVTLPYTVREIAYVLQELGTSEEEAATTLGASSWQTFWHVTLPNIRVALGYGLLMTMARALGEFGAVLVLGGSISGQTQTATTFIHDAIEERQVDAAYGMAVVLAALSIALLLALEWAKAKRQTAIKKV